MRPLLIVGDHPSLHRGFSTVGRHLARHLHLTARWRVQFIGRYPRAAGEPDEPYQVFDADREDDVDDVVGQRRLGDLLGAVITHDRSDTRPMPILSIGTARDQKLVLDWLDELGLRSVVRLVGYMPVDFAPLPPVSAELIGRFDLMVPFTAFAGEALRAVRGGSGPPEVSAPIPHGVDLAIFHPPEVGSRSELRRRFFGVEDDDAILIGYFGRNSAHKHPDLALRIFATFATGRYGRCAACGAATSFDADRLDDGRAAPSCTRCGSPRLERGAPCEHARLYLHTELLTREERAHAGGWDLERLASRLCVDHLVRFDRSLRIGVGVPVAELAARMGACDIHLLPFEGGGWELTLLETAACGVANVITGFGAPPEYAACFSELVPPVVRLWGPAGVRGVIDVDRAVEALLLLTEQPDHRRRLAREGHRVAMAHSWAEVGKRWEELLASPRIDSGGGRT